MIVGEYHVGTPAARWWRRRAESGGQFVEQACHLVDLARVLAGEARSPRPLVRISRGPLFRRRHPGRRRGASALQERRRGHLQCDGYPAEGGIHRAAPYLRRCRGHCDALRNDNPGRRGHAHGSRCRERLLARMPLSSMRSRRATRRRVYCSYGRAPDTPHLHRSRTVR